MYKELKRMLKGMPVDSSIRTEIGDSTFTVIRSKNTYITLIKFNKYNFADIEDLMYFLNEFIVKHELDQLLQN